MRYARVLSLRCTRRGHWGGRVVDGRVRNRWAVNRAGVAEGLREVVLSEAHGLLKVEQRYLLHRRKESLVLASIGISFAMVLRSLMKDRQCHRVDELLLRERTMLEYSAFVERGESFVLITVLTMLKVFEAVFAAERDT